MKLSDNKHTYTGPVLLMAFSLLTLITATRLGIGLQPDTSAYFKMTRTLLPDTCFPPGYAVMLRAVTGLGMDLFTGARWLNIFLLTASVLMVWYVIHQSTASGILSFVGAWLVLTSTRFLDTHISALSDPAFIFWCLAGLLFLSRYLETGAWGDLFISGLSCAFAFMTRFAGAPLIAVGFLAILFSGPDHLKKRLDAGLAFMGISGAPMTLWLGYYRLMHSTSGFGREFIGATFDAERFIAGANMLASFLLPTAVPNAIRFPLLMAVVCGMGMMIWALYKPASPKTRSQPADKRVHVLILFVLCYSGFLILSVIIDPKLGFAGRYLVPVYVAAVPLFAILAHEVLKRQNRSRTFPVVMACLIGLGLSHSVRAVKWTHTHYRNGCGYASTEWKNSALMEQVRQLDPSVPIYTNGHDAIFFLARRQVSRLPEKIFRRTGKPRPGYPDQIERIRQDLVNNNGVIVYFDAIHWRYYMPTPEELMTQLPIKIASSAPDGVIYKYRGNTFSTFSEFSDQPNPS